jgi:iron complex outermembrane receptor protein
MTRMKTLACSVCMLLVGVAPVAADNDAPKSLRMRSKKAPGSHWSPMRWAKRIAQAQPAPDQPPPAGGDQPPPAEPSGAQPAAEPAPNQPAPAPEGGAAPAPTSPALSDEELAKLSEQEAKTEVITVTGSLIGRKEVDSPSPLTVVDKEKLEGAGVTNVGDVLQKIPAQGNALNAQNNNGGNGSTRIDLRSLTPARTLVLLNGRRVVPSGLGADTSVDFGTIPLAMIERVEVLKDGASAIYGSDAIAGVVNIITRSNMNGTEASVYTSTTSHNDGTNYDLSFVTGHSSNRGNITFSGGYQKQDPVMAGDRGFSNLKHSYGFSSCSDDDIAMGMCAVQSGSPSGATGRINALVKGHELQIPGCNPTADNPYCTSDGTGGFRNYMGATATTLGDNYNFQPLNYILTPSSRVNLFSNGHYDITRNAHVFFEGQFNSRSSEQQLAEEPVDLGLFGIAYSAKNAYNQFGQDIVDYRRRLTEFGPRSSKQNVNTTRLVVGLNGNLPEELGVLNNWKWETSYNYGRNESTQASHGDLILSHLAAALGPTFQDGANGLGCGTSKATQVANCVPLDLLHPGMATIPKAAIDYLTFTGTQSGFNDQHTALATTSGKLVDLPNHGDISLAIGGDYRFERGGQQPDPLTATGDTTGNANAPTLGSYHAFEGFGELSVVPFSGGEFLKWVELNAAGRAYSYNTFGSGVTGKITGLVRVDHGIAMRGTYGNAFRAPNVNELFSGQADSFPAIEDPCDQTPPSAKGKMVQLSDQAAKQCAADHPGGNVPAGSSFNSSQQRTTIGGNPKLTSETAQVGTAGLVYEPLRGLALTADYWHINIDNAITTLPVTTILSQCYEAGQESFCNQITRNDVHQISHVLDTFQNVGSITTSGLDFSASYQYRTNAGTFRHSLEGTYLFQYNVDTGTIDPNTMTENVIHGRGNYDLNGLYPDLKFNVFTTWSHPSGLGAGINLRFVNSSIECEDNNCNLNHAADQRREVSKYVNGDLFASYALKSTQGTTSVTVGMNNALNVTPPLVYNNIAQDADPSVYDFLGRQFYVRLSQLF